MNFGRCAELTSLLFCYVLTYKMIGKKPSWWKRYIPGKKTVTVVGGLALAGLGKLAHNYVNSSQSEPQQSRPQQPPRPQPRPQSKPQSKPKPKPRPPPPRPRGDPCQAVMCPKGIASRRDYLKWAARGGHPDKGGSTAIFQSVNNCQSDGRFCKR